MPLSINICSDLNLTDHNACMNCRKRNHSLLSDLSQEELELLNKGKHEITYKGGEVICKAGTIPSGLICLKEGKVKIVRTGVNGNEQIIKLKKPVDFLGFNALMSGNHHTNSAVALEDSYVCVIDKNNFLEVIKNNSSFAIKLIRFFAQELNQANKRQLDLTQKHMRSRVADALLQIHDMYGTDQEGDYLNISLKRADLAALANLTTANAIRVLSAFAKEDLIETNRKKIKIHNIKAIREISLSGQ